jgi:hypothetical protein
MAINIYPAVFGFSINAKKNMIFSSLSAVMPV